jgi:hypothetical protein
MPVPLKLIISRVPGGMCSRCQGTGISIRLDLFTSNLAGRSDPLCLGCLATVEEIEGEILMKDLLEGQPARSRRPLLKRQKRMSQKQEVDIALELSASVQKASGALAGMKGDIRKKGVVRVEAKYTEANSFVLKLAELDKVAGECHGRERPVLVLDFKEKGTGKMKGRFAVVHFDDAKEMFNAAGHHR